ncbi:hypothetical protein [Natrinema salinisoli]|uniref:hypothetical protein n=1 Tax=Natrinema salinisoli TaxID=2878535 RepID=UPI001CF02808|nr:hypothetical protein [Natrinema salinisoli]
MTIEHDTEPDAEGHLLTITDQSGNRLEQVFTFDGTPVTNVSNSTEIDEQKLDPTLEIGDETTPQQTAGAGYEVGAAGYEVGSLADRETSQTITYTITLNATAFDTNEYDAQVALITDQVNESYTPPVDTWPSDDLGTAYASNNHTFEITTSDQVAKSDKPSDRTVHPTFTEQKSGS